MGYSPPGCKESDRTEWLTLTFLNNIIELLVSRHQPIRRRNEGVYRRRKSHRSV